MLNAVRSFAFATDGECVWCVQCVSDTVPTKVQQGGFLPTIRSVAMPVIRFVVCPGHRGRSNAGGFLTRWNSALRAQMHIRRSASRASLVGSTPPPTESVWHVIVNYISRLGLVDGCFSWWCLLDVQTHRGYPAGDLGTKWDITIVIERVSIAVLMLLSAFFFAISGVSLL